MMEAFIVSETVVRAFSNAGRSAPYSLKRVKFEVAGAGRIDKYLKSETGVGAVEIRNKFGRRSTVLAANLKIETNPFGCSPAWVVRRHMNRDRALVSVSGARYMNASLESRIPPSAASMVAFHS